MTEAAAGFDYTGVSVLIGVVASAVVSVGNFILQIKAQKETKLARADTSQKLEVLHNLTNSQSEKLNQAIADGSFAAGEASGIAKERAEPMVARQDVADEGPKANG